MYVELRLCLWCLYRFTKDNLHNIVTIIEADIKYTDGRGSPLTPLQQVCLTLSYLAHGSFQHVSGALLGTCKATAHRTVHRVLRALDAKAGQFVALPVRSEMREASNKILHKYGFPGAALGVDGTFVKLSQKPEESDLPAGNVCQDFWCRKQTYALNVMVCGDPNYFIREVAIWAGSTHDARVWRSSSTKAFMEEQEEFVCLGDTAYPMSRTLMKPYADPSGNRQVAFNRALCGARTQMTENVIGMWKKRFPILQKGIGTRLGAAARIVRVCALLHNLSRGLGDEAPQTTRSLRMVKMPEMLQVVTITLPLGRTRLE